MLGRDAASGLFFMAYLDPQHHPVWKSRLLQGQVEPAFAQQVGTCLGQMHRFTAAQAALAEQFKSDAFFTATLSKWAGKDKNKLKAMEAITTFCKNKSNTILCLDRFKLSDLPVEVFHLPSMSHCNELSVKEDAIFEPTHFSGDGDAWYFKQNEHSLESDLKRLPKDIEVKKWTERQIFKQA
ncbi:MAG: hypothetical protein EBZ47_05435 [Chlamydiae bacterium]|nr:hypothetical protein [Chlamydiota bacterium]